MVTDWSKVDSNFLNNYLGYLGKDFDEEFARHKLFSHAWAKSRKSEQLKTSITPLF